MPGPKLVNQLTHVESLLHAAREAHDLAHLEALIRSARRVLAGIATDLRLAAPPNQDHVHAVVVELDRLKAPLDSSVRSAMALLQAEGCGRRKDTVSAALKQRRRQARFDTALSLND